MMDWTMMIGLGAILCFGAAALAVFSKRVVLWEHELGVHFHKGKQIGSLAAGEHWFWGRGHEVTRFDGRWQETVIQGQEFLTADKIGVKVSGLVRYRVADAEVHLAASSEAGALLYSAVQMALREVVGKTGVDGVLERQEDFGLRLFALVAPTAKKLGYEIMAVLIRDLMISGDLKRVYTEALTAKQESLVSLEKARGEAAAMRVMANAARVFEQNPSLLQLRFLQMLESGVCRKSSDGSGDGTCRRRLRTGMRSKAERVLRLFRGGGGAC